MTKYIFLIIVLALIASYIIRSNANREAAKINAIEAEQFLAKNRQVEGVMETESGLQYQVLSVGSG